MQKHLTNAIDDYHRVISRDLSAAEEQLKLLVELQHSEDVLFGGRAMANTLRPTFITESRYQDVHETVYLIRQAIIKIAAAFFNDRDVLKNEIGLRDWEIELASIPTKIIRLSATARMDSFATEDSFKFVELNAEVPAGIAYIHKLGEIYRRLPIFQEFAKSNPVRFVSPLQHMVDGLLRIYREEFDGDEEFPTFAIVDLLDQVPTVAEFRLIKSYLERHGYNCVIADPRALEVHDGWVYADGKKVDILYRRFLANEYYELRDECTAYMEGYVAQKTCFLNSFRTKLVHKKALFAFLSDERYTHVLNDREIRAIQNHIPWTRLLRDQKTVFRGLTIDLVEFVRSNQKHFVIKPNDEYGGKGVTIGFAADAAEWDAAIDGGLNRGFVVQECVHIHREPFLQKTSDGWQMVPTVVDLDPYLNGALMGGCLTRISATNLANVTAGGGTLPLFILRYS